MSLPIPNIRCFQFTHSFRVPKCEMALYHIFFYLKILVKKEKNLRNCRNYKMHFFISYTLHTGVVFSTSFFSSGIHYIYLLFASISFPIVLSSEKGIGPRRNDYMVAYREETWYVMTEIHTCTGHILRFISFLLQFSRKKCIFLMIKIRLL